MLVEVILEARRPSWVAPWVVRVAQARRRAALLTQDGERLAGVAKGCGWDRACTYTCT